MQPMNGYIQIKKITNDKIAWDEGNEYEVVEGSNTPSLTWPRSGDIVIVEYDRIIKVSVNNEETLFVHEDLILAKINGPKRNDSDTAPEQGRSLPDVPDFSPR